MTSDPEKLVELIRLTGIHFMDQNQPYLAVLYQALFSTAYFGLFRVSEITLSPSEHVIRVTDVHMGQNTKKILFVLRSSKTHGPYAKPQMIKISSSPMGTERTSVYCPYQLLRNYISMRPKFISAAEPFFIFRLINTHALHAETDIEN